MKRVRAGTLALLGTMAALACDSGPSGPGSFRAILEPPPEAAVGAALLTVSGEGVRGISADGSTRVFSSVADQSGTYRVLLVSTSPPEDLRFEVEVRDVGAAPPTVTVLELASVDNLPVDAVAEARVRFEL